MIWIFLAPGTRIQKGVVEKPCRAIFDLVEGARLGYVFVVLQRQFRRNKARLSDCEIGSAICAGWSGLDASTVRRHQPTSSAKVEANPFQADHSPIVVLLLIICRKVSSNNMQN
jgi:hypothetical protein